MKKIILSTLLLCLSPFGFSQSSCENPTTNIYFVNGVGNIFIQARYIAEEIEEAYREQLEFDYPDQIFEFKVAHNVSHGALRDVFEALIGILPEGSPGETEGLTAAQWAYRYLTESRAELLDPLEDPSFRESMFTTLDYLRAAQITLPANTSAHTEEYRQALTQGSRVVLIAHSQGGQLSSASVEELLNEYPDSIATIGLGIASTSYPDGSTYHSAHDDFIINLARTLTANVILPSNIDNDLGLLDDPRDISNHEFLESYFLDELPSREELNFDLEFFVSNLEFPNCNDTNYRYTKISSTGEDLPYTAEEWDCVRDKNTGLVWERKSDDVNSLHFISWSYIADDFQETTHPSVVGGWPECLGGRGSHCGINAFTGQVNTTNLCGSSNWRLPSLNELQLLNECPYQYEKPIDYTIRTDGLVVSPSCDVTGGQYLDDYIEANHVFSNENAVFTLYSTITSFISSKVIDRCDYEFFDQSGIACSDDYSVFSPIAVHRSTGEIHNYRAATIRLVR